MGGGPRARRPPPADDGGAGPAWPRSPTDGDVVVVCRIGGRSAQVVAYLINQGWDNVRNLDGGMEDWAAGRPTEWSAKTGSPARVDLNPFHRWATTPLVFAHRGSSAVLPEHTLPRTCARSTRAPTGWSATSGSPATGTWSACTTAGSTAPATARAGSAGTPWPSWTRSTSARGAGPPAELRRPTRSGPGPAAHARPAARRRARRRPAGAAADRDQTPHPVRRGRRAPAGRAAAPVRAGRARARRPGPGDGDVVLRAGRAPDAASWPPACPRRCCWRCSRRACARPACRSAPGSPAPASAWSGPGPSWSPRCRPAGNQVYVWTVNEADDLDLVLELGVDGIITDRPAFVLDRSAAEPFPFLDPHVGVGRLEDMPRATRLSRSARQPHRVIDRINSGEAGLPRPRRRCCGRPGGARAPRAWRSPSTDPSGGRIIAATGAAEWALGRPVDRHRPAHRPAAHRASVARRVSVDQLDGELADQLDRPRPAHDGGRPGRDRRAGGRQPARSTTARPTSRPAPEHHDA